MSLRELEDWLDEQSRPGVLWYIKRLSANDTQKSKGHQAGPYIPKSVIFEVAPSLQRTDILNPRVSLEALIDSHDDTVSVDMIWYNNQKRGHGTRNEARVTGWGGTNSALLDPENTGALTVFAFSDDLRCRVWVCRNIAEEEAVEGYIGPVEPRIWKVWSIDRADLIRQLRPKLGCRLEPHEIPREWLTAMPSGEDILRKVLTMRPERSANADRRLVIRRNCELAVFRSLEDALYLPRIREGFSSLDDFLPYAQTVIQRRKSRSGRSLELQMREIFREEGVMEGRDFEYQAKISIGRQPDFLFPGVTAYRDESFPASRLRILAVKTRLKERWRQVLDEAPRIERKHLLTLDDGVTGSQFTAMREAGIQLVVPKGLQKDYPEDARPHLQTLESFLGEVREQAR